MYYNYGIVSHMAKSAFPFAVRAVTYMLRGRKESIRKPRKFEEITCMCIRVKLGSSRFKHGDEASTEQCLCI